MFNKKISLTQLAAKANRQVVLKSCKFLKDKIDTISNCQNLEDFAEKLDADDPKFKGVNHHFCLVRNQILSKLRGRGVIIGISVIEELLFLAVKNQEVNDPVAEVFRVIKHFGLHRPGFILYPIHSIGFVGIGFTKFFSGKKYRFILEEAGIAISPQNNNEKNLINFIESSTIALKLKRKQPVDELYGLAKGEAVRWMTDNPLMIVKCRSFSQDYFENQSLLIIKLKFATTLVTMLSAMQKHIPDDLKIYSTSGINNFSTLDIKHYVVFETMPRSNSKFRVRRVPISYSKAELSELSELNFELNPLEWARRKPLAGRVIKAMQFIEKGYMEHSLGQSLVGKTSSASKLFRKIFLSLEFFRRSFRNSAKGEDGIVNLAVAFETLLTDCYAPGVAQRIKRRLSILLKGVRGQRKMVNEVRLLYDARNSSVHTGKAESEPDRNLCRMAFIHAFLSLIICYKSASFNRFDQLSIGNLIGDISTDVEIN